MADQFLSCDGNFLHVPKDNFKKKEASPTMISISTISASLSTDDSSLIRKKIPEPRVCCVLPVTSVSIFAATFTSILTLSLYIYCVIRVVQHSSPELNKEKVIVLLSVAACILLSFAALFAWGIFGKRPGFLLPNILLSTCLLFAIIGISVFTFVTAADEIREDSNGVLNKVLFRVILVLLALLEAFFVFVFIRSFLYLRRKNRNK